MTPTTQIARPRHAQRWLVVAGWVGAVALSAALIPLAVAAEAVATDSSDTGGFVPFVIAIATVGVAEATTGTILLLRVPGNRVGALLYIGGPLIVSCIVGWSGTVLRTVAYGTDDVLGGLALVWSGIMLPIAIVIAFPAVGICFPDGRLPGRRWRVPVGAIVALFAGSAVLLVVSPWPAQPDTAVNPFSIEAVPAGAYDLAQAMGSLAMFGSFIVAAAAVVVRWRRSSGTERAQMKWFAASLAVSIVLFPLSWTTDVGGEVVDLLSVAAILLLPAAIGVAVLRYRLYEIDRLISRTIGWALVTGLLLAIFGGGVIALTTILAGFTEGQTLAVAASTLIAFALFQPIRRRVQHAVDRRFDRSRYDGQMTVDAFAREIRDEVDLPRLREALATTANDAVRPEATSVWLREAKT
jgi:hypothetical protein